METSGDWVTQRLGYAYLLKRNKRLLNVNQSLYFIKKMSVKAIDCLPAAVRVEIVAGKVVNLGFKVALRRTILMLKEEKSWSTMHKAFESAAIALVDLHEKHDVYQGGLAPETITFSGAHRTAKFLNWAHLCSEAGVSGRLHNPSQYYFKASRSLSLADLKLQNLLELVQMHSDMVCA